MEETEMKSGGLVCRWLFLFAFFLMLEHIQGAEIQQHGENQIVYRGRARTDKWLTHAHHVFAKQIAFHAGLYHDIGLKQTMCQLARPDLASIIPGPEYIELKNAEVLQVLDPNREFLFSATDRIIHVAVPSGLNAVDGDTLELKLICSGTYRYKSIAGAIKTVRSFRCR